MSQNLNDILRCPACAARPEPDPGQLELIRGRWFVCQDCGRKYPIRNGIPVMLVDEGNKHRHTRVDALGEP